MLAAERADDQVERDAQAEHDADGESLLRRARRQVGENEMLFFGNGSVCFQHRGGFVKVFHQLVVKRGWYALTPRRRSS